jgi:hypothetical protein
MDIWIVVLGQFLTWVISYTKIGKHDTAYYLQALL